MNDTAKQHFELVKRVVQGGPPRTPADVARAIGIKRHILDDCYYKLQCEGLAQLRTNGVWEWIGPTDTTATPSCACDQHGESCPVHPNCACGCPKHAHRGDAGSCIGGRMDCLGCIDYRPAQLRPFEVLTDDELDEISLTDLREKYRNLRTHHTEKVTALRWR